MFEMLIFIAFAIVLLLLIAFFYFRDQSVFQKLQAYESAIDDIQSRLYRLENQPLPQKESKSDLKELILKLEDRFDGKLSEVGEPLLRTIRALKAIEDRLEKLEKKVDEKIGEIRNAPRTQENLTDTSRYEERVITLYKEGKSIEEISKLTRIGVGEIDLMLRLAKLKK